MRTLAAVPMVGTATAGAGPGAATLQVKLEVTTPPDTKLALWLHVKVPVGVLVPGVQPTVIAFTEPGGTLNGVLMVETV